jgi:lysyl-tRNA synthetase class II
MIKLAGRISNIRKHGKTTFIDIREHHLRIQLAIKTLKEEDVIIHRGDVIGV